MTPLKSSNIAGIERDGDDLIVYFKNGGAYRYAGAAAHHDTMVDAESAGRYFHNEIRGKYEFRRHEPEAKE